MNRTLLLGVDIGTSSCKITVIDEKSEIIAVGKSEYKVNNFNGNCYEQNAEDYWNGTLIALKEINQKCPQVLSKVKAIGVIGQTSTEIFVDSECKPLRPAIIWRDTRAVEEAEMIKRDIGEEKLFSLLGAHVPVTANWAASRLLWVSRNEPETAQKTYKILQPKDYVNYKLTGKYFSDKWINKSVVNTYTGEVPCEYINYLGFAPDVIPPVFAPFEVCGNVTKEVAELTGLSEGTPVVAGWSDGPATMLGSGAFEKEGIAFNCTGTSEIVGLSVKDTVYVDGLMTIPAHITGSVAVVYGPTQSGSSSLLWYGSQVRDMGFEELINEAEKEKAGCGGMVFLPYISGERAPIWDAEAHGAFVNISSQHNNGSFARAVMEGVAFSVRHILDTATKETGIKLGSIRLSGGGSRAELWCKIRADVCKTAVQMTACDETSALGAVMLAGVGIGLWKNLCEASEKMVRTVFEYTPNAKNYTIYDKNYYCYREIYKALRDINKEKI